MKTVYKKSVKPAVASEKELRSVAPRRKAYSDKYKSGRVVVIGGSSAFYGAPAISLQAAYNTLAALRIGTGYVRTYVPHSVLSHVRSVSPNMIVLGSGDRDIIFTEQMKSDINRTDAVVLGMGMGRTPISMGAAKSIIKYCQTIKRKTIIDADAQYALRSFTTKADGNILITPHDAEFLRLFNIQLPQEDLKKRIIIASKTARIFGIIILLKGHVSIITDGSRTKLVKSRSAALATMGTGDALSGIIAGYAATGASLFDSAVAGAYLHSTIGDALFREKGNHVLATDIIEKIPAIIKKFDKK